MARYKFGIIIFVISLLVFAGAFIIMKMQVSSTEASIKEVKAETVKVDNKLMKVEAEGNKISASEAINTKDISDNLVKVQKDMTKYYYRGILGKLSQAEQTELNKLVNLYYHYCSVEDVADDFLKSDMMWGYNPKYEYVHDNILNYQKGTHPVSWSIKLDGKIIGHISGVYDSESRMFSGLDVTYTEKGLADNTSFRDAPYKVLEKEKAKQDAQKQKENQKNKKQSENSSKKEDRQ